MVFLIICLFVFTIPCENILILPGVGTLSRFVGLLAFCLGAFALMFLKKGIRVHLLHKFMAGFLFWSFLTYFWSSDQALSLVRLATYTQMLLMMWLIYQWIVDEKGINALLGAYVLGCYKML